MSALQLLQVWLTERAQRSRRAEVIARNAYRKGTTFADVAEHLANTHARAAALYEAEARCIQEMLDAGRKDLPRTPSEGEPR